MIRAKVIKSFYYAKDKVLYLDEERFKELESQGYVEEYKAPTEIETASLKPSGKRRVLSEPSVEVRKEDCMD